MAFCNKNATFGRYTSQFYIIMKFIYSAICAAALGLGCLTADAVPAQPGVFTRLQPDGTVVSLMLHGDEFGHYMTDTGGHVVVEARDGSYRYATAGADGVAVASDYIVSDSPSESCRAFLSGVDSRRIIDAAMTRRADRLKARAVARSRDRIGLMSTSDFPLKGSPRTLVILVEYSNVGFRIHDPADFFNRMLNAETFTDAGAEGSARQWFVENSCGQFVPQFDVIGPVTLPHTQAYYGQNNKYNQDANPTAMVIDACQAVDDYVNFNDYDIDGDGMVDNVYIFYAGLSEAQGGGANCVWPHQWSVYTDAGQDIPLDNVKLNHYACSNEWQPLDDVDEGGPAGMGTFCHEFGHVLGLPDLYATNYCGAITMGDWDVMDHGSYNNDGYTPPLYSAYERYALGWIEPRVISGDATITLRDITGNTACLIPTAKETEFYMLENRQQTGWNRFVPGHGMLVWHVDYVKSVFDANTVNNNLTHQYVDLVEADGSWDNPDNRAAHAFPGTAGITTLTDETTPSMKTWDGTPLGLPVTGIAEKDGLITFNVGNGAAPLPAVTGLSVAETTPYTLTLKWNAVPGATSYRVSLALRGADKAIVQFREIKTEVPAITFEGLTPETDYTATVRAESAGAESPDVSADVSSGMLTFDYRSPVATAATDITGSSFTANWEEMSGADSYLLSVFSSTLGNATVDLKDFDNGLADVSRGWSVNTGRLYAEAENAGVAPPSLRFSGSGWILTSPTYSKPISKVSFWYKGVNVAEGATLTIKYLINGEFTDGEEIEVANEGRIFTAATVPEGTQAVELRFNRESGELAMDDILIEWGAVPVYTPLEGMSEINVGNVTSYVVSGLSPESKYGYSVKGLSGTVKSLSSATIDLTTGQSAIVTIGVDDENDVTAEYYTLQGIRVGKPVPGTVVICRRGAKVTKILVR